MFKLIYLKLSQHNQLGELEVSFVGNDEANNVSKPYTSVIIGANGTGKSYLLRTIAEIFHILHDYKNLKYKRTGLGYLFHLRYKIDNNEFEVVSRHLLTDLIRRSEGHLLFFKNLPQKFSIFNNSAQNFKKYEISTEALKLPTKVVVSSIMLNDRFIFADSQPEDFYQYLGIRRTPNSTSTKTFQKKTIRYLFDASRSGHFLSHLKDMLHFMGFEEYFKIHYHTRYNRLFFSGTLNRSEFKKFFEQWWESSYTNRDKSNPPWGKWYYDKLLKENPKQIKDLVDFLNVVANDKNKLLHKPRSRSKLYEVDLFGEYEYAGEFELIEDLVKLDILSLDGIKIKKCSSELSIDQTSSGEYHLIISLLGLYSKIQHSSLVLIDEPEISLHPNWQMQYVNFLKRMFKRYANCHFIITTHSHFLISDLENDSSSVVMMKRGVEDLEASLLESNTYGWSAEQVLLKVFETPSSRNFYLTEELNNIFELISHDPTKRSVKEIKDRVAALRKLDLSGLTDADPLKDVINELFKKF